MCNLLYGTASNVHTEHVSACKKENLLKKIVTLEDQKALTQAVLVLFIAKHHFPFTLVLHLHNLAQLLSKDHELLTSLGMSPSTAS